MTLGIGNHLAKLAEDWSTGTRVVKQREVVEGEAYHEFEILTIDGSQGDPGGFSVRLKLVE